MFEMNGIVAFEKEDSLPQLPEGLSDDIPVRAPFGFLIENEGDTYYWRPASELEFRQAEGKRLGIAPSEVVIKGSCVQTGPRECNWVYCGNGYRCKLLYQPEKNYYYCACS